MKKKQAVRISACMIMRDAAADLGDSLGSLEGLVDEFVVVDTGSQDDSVAIAKRYAGKVYEVPWQEDFSLAKNYAIERATGDWIVFLDSDEGLTEETRKNLRPILSLPGLPEKADALLVPRFNIRTDTGEKETENLPERIFRRDPALRFRDPIHEYLAFADGHPLRMVGLKPEQLAIWHRGYSPERAREKSDRNVRMLEKMREQGIPKMFLHYYLAREYLYREEYAKAAEAAREAIRQGESPGDPFLPYQQLYEAQEHLGKEEDILGTLRQGMKAHPLRPEFYAAYGMRMKEKGNRREALSFLRLAVRNAQKFRHNYPGLHNGAQEQVPQLYIAMAEICESAGKHAKALSYRKKAAAYEKAPL